MKKLYKKIPFLVLLLCSNFQIYSQNCSVNADIDLTICENEQMTLNGNTAGLFKAPSDLLWTQIAGPSISIVSNTSAITNVIGYSPGNSYTFRLSASCQDNVKVQDEVTITVIPVSIATAGADQTACPGSSTLTGNAPGANETGSWSIIGSNNAGVSIITSSSPTSSFTTPTTSAGQTTLRWTITNINGCSSFDDLIVTNFGGDPVVTTNVPSVNLGNCYSTTQCYQLNASFGGNGFGGQQGVWSQVSGPNNVSFTSVNARNSSVCGLTTGCYVVKWTVSGPCANGSDTVRICVPPPTQSVTTATFSNQVFCDGRTIANLIGNAPTYTGETVLWEKVSGPAIDSFANDSSSTTAVFGLDGTSTYQFRYTITNPLTGCSSSSLGSISYAGAPSIVAKMDTVLGCGIDQYMSTLIVNGGNRTYYQVVTAPDSWSLSAPTGLIQTGNTLTINNLDAPGNYVVKLLRTTDNGVSCQDFSTSFVITVSDIPEGANAGTDQFLACNIPSTSLAGNKPRIGYGTWTQISGPSTLTLSDINDPNTSVSGFTDGTYNLNWFISGGPACPKVEDIVQVIWSSLPPQSVSAGPAKTVCHSSPINLDANVPVVGEVGVWTVTPPAGVTIADVNNPKTSVTGLVASTAYTFKWKVTNRCGVDSSNVVITTNTTQGPPQAFAGADRCLASGTTSITLAGNNPSPASGLWTKISGPAATITNDTLFNTTVTGLTNGIYLFEWRNTNGTCDPTQDTTEITISGMVTTANAGADKDICSNSVTMTANTPTAGTGTWSQFSGPSGWQVNNINSPTAQFTSLVTGEYKFIWTISAGSCLSSTDTVTINIDNAPTIPTAGISQKICNGVSPLSITLSGNTMTTGTATWSIIGLSPNTPSIVSPSSSTTGVNGLVTGIYIFARTAYSTGGVCPTLRDTVADTIVMRSVAGEDREFCGAVSSLDFTGPQFSIGTWTKISGGTVTIDSSSANSAIVTGTSADSSPYQFVYTIPARWGCPLTADTVKVTLFDTTRVPYAGLDDTICTATSVMLNANNLSPDSALWTQVFGPSSTIVNDTLFNTVVNNINIAGIYLYKWETVNGPCKRSDEVRIEKFDPPTTSVAGPDVTICPSEFTMAGNAATIGVGNWTQISGPVIAVIQEQVNPMSVISGLTAVGTYEFVWSINNGPICAVSRDTMEINVPFLNPTVANAGVDSAICNRTATALNGNSPSIGTGAWSQYTSAPASTISTPTSNTSPVTLTTSGDYGYVWTTTNGGCISRDSVVYTLSDLPTVSDAGGNTLTCIGQEVRLNGNGPSAGNGTWRQITGPFSVGFADSTDRNTLVFGLDTGTYILRWQITSGSCPPSDDFDTVMILKRPADAIAGANQILCTDNFSLFGSEDSIGAPAWSNLSGPNTPSITTPNSRGTTVTGLTNGLYKFLYTITNGSCANIDSVEAFYRFPENNNTCTNADSITSTNLTSTVDSLCSATAEAGEPGTCGRPACNSLIYKIKTENTGVWKDLYIDFTQLSTCSNGLRVSLFNDGACPALGSQVGPCQTTNTTGTLTFPFIAPNTVFYIVVDDNSPTCGASNCVFNFVLGGALPVELIEFNAKSLNNNSALLKWKTASEVNNEKFIIERKALQQSEFRAIGEVKGAGNSSQTLSYSFIDELKNEKAKTFLYRLKQIDFNGDFEYSDIEVVELKNIAQLTLYPNPARNEISIGSVTNKNLSYSIINSIGKKVKTGETVNDSPINIVELPAGIYFVIVTDGLDNEETFKLSIE